LHYTGRGFPKDNKEAARWYRKAAELGFTVSMSKLAKMYHDGDGVAKDYEQAYAWAALAMERAPAKAEKERYLPLATHMAQELDSEEFERAKKMKNELS
jgi:TPR repeat protein